MIKELSGKIIGAAMDALNELRPGLDDPAVAGLRTRIGHRIKAPWSRSFDPESISCFYCGELIGNLVSDLIVDDAVIVDPKVVACFTDTHVAPNDWVPKHHGIGSGHSDQFQKCAIGMETRVAFARARGKTPA